MTGIRQRAQGLWAVGGGSVMQTATTSEELPGARRLRVSYAAREWVLRSNALRRRHLVSEGERS